MLIPALPEIQENFALFDDWEDRYSYLIDLGNALPKLADNEYVDTNLVPGCTSQVWLVVDATDPLQFRVDSDALIVKGLLALIQSIFAGKTTAELTDVNPQHVFEELGLAQHLSPNRRNGFFAISQKLQELA